NLEGVVIVADENFGMGSNRASSVRALKVAGVRAVIARSVAPLYAMGARDEGLPVVVLDDDKFFRLADPEASVEIELSTGWVRVNGREFVVAPSSAYEMEL